MPEPILTAHQLARLLLEGPDLLVSINGWTSCEGLGEEIGQGFGVIDVVERKTVYNHYLILYHNDSDDQLLSERTKNEHAQRAEQLRLKELTIPQGEERVFLSSGQVSRVIQESTYGEEWPEQQTKDITPKTKQIAGPEDEDHTV